MGELLLNGQVELKPISETELLDCYVIMYKFQLMLKGNHTGTAVQRSMKQVAQ